jgi:hypothetical protein
MLDYDADVTLSGDHTGFLRATAVRGDAANGFTGSIESEVDGSIAVLELG